MIIFIHDCYQIEMPPLRTWMVSKADNATSQVLPTLQVPQVEQTEEGEVNYGTALRMIGVTNRNVSFETASRKWRLRMAEVRKGTWVDRSRRVRVLSQAKQTIKEFHRKQLMLKCACGEVKSRYAKQCQLCRWKQRHPIPIQIPMLQDAA